MSSRCTALLLVLLVGITARARAQDAPQAGPTASAQEAPKPAEKKKPPINTYAFGFMLGWAKVTTGEVTNPTYVAELDELADSLSEAQLEQYGLISESGCDPIERTCRTDARHGVHLVFPIQIGGAGVSFRLDPYMTLADSAKAYGLYTGPNFQFHVAHPLYIGFGFGLKAAWVKADDWKYAADLYGRIPFHATYYVHDDVAVVAEFGFSGGASGYVGEIRDVINPTTGRRIARKSDVTFGVGRSFDLSFGVRFP